MWKVPLFDTDFGEEEHEAVRRVLNSGWVTMGEVTQAFERRFAELLNVNHALAVSSGTAALHLANRVLGVEAGDEVICPSLTFVAAANTIVCQGARPVFADVQSADHLCISPDDIEKRVTRRTKAIQVMHYAGYPCDMNRILEVAKQHGLRVIEDSAHAPGAEYKGRKCGTIGDVGCFSFFSNKNLTTAEGGMVTTNDDALAEELRLLRSHGMTSLTLDRHKGRAHSYDVLAAGYNYRIDEIRSAIGLVQLDKFHGNQLRRRQIEAWYRERLDTLRGIRVPFAHPTGMSANHILPILLEDGAKRSRFMHAMKERGIQTSIHYPPIHLFQYYRDALGRSDLPTTEDVATREVTLPLYPAMGAEDVTYVCEAVRHSLDG